jgi:hypothetical protein
MTTQQIAIKQDASQQIKPQIPKDQVAKQKKPTKSKADQFVDHIVRETDLGKAAKNTRYGYYDDEYGWCAPTVDYIFEDMPEPTIEMGSKLSELAIYKALKKNKKIKEALDNLFKKLASNLIGEADDTMKNIMQDRKYAEKEAQRQAKIKAQQDKAAAKEAERKKKEKIKQAILNETLSTKQKSLIKSLYKVKIK